MVTILNTIKTIEYLYNVKLFIITLFQLNIKYVLTKISTILLIIIK